MRFSVLIPVYKTEPQLFEKCINFAKNQITKNDSRFLDYEIVICFDGKCKEHDFLRSMLDTLLVKRNCSYQVFTSEENQGVSATRNNCLSLAQGDWIVWCDSDDTLQPFALSVLEDYIVKYQDKYDCYCYKANIYDLVGVDYSKSMIDNYIGDTVFYDLHTSNAYFGKVPEVLWRKCISKQFIDKNKISFDNDIKLYDDWYFHNILCMHLTTVYKIDKALYNYTIRENSLSSNSEKDNKRDYILKIAEKLWKQAENRAYGLDYLEQQERIDDYCKEFLGIK